MPEKSARMAEDYQWLMFDSMPFCCALWNEKIKRLDCNLETVKLLGYKDKQEFLNNSFDIFTEYQPDGSPSVEKCVEMLKMTLIKGHSVFELVVKTLRGDLIPAEITLVKVNLKNEHVAVAAYLRDLREIKAAGNKAAMAYKRTQTILDAALVCCHLWDKDLKIIDCNIEALKLFELSSKEEYAERYFELSPEHQPDGQPSKLKIIAMVKLAFDTGRSVFEWMHQNLNGDPIPTEKTLVRVDLGDGRTGVEVYTMDLREVRDAEAKVLELYKSALSKEAEKRVRMILESTPLCCHFWDEKINIIDCNLESLELFEFSNKQEYLDRFFELSPEYQPDGKPSDKKAREAIKTAFDTGYITFEWMHRKLDGGFIPAKVTLIRVELGDGHKGIAAYVQDLREEKAAEARIRDAEKRARIILDATPLCTQLWDANQNMIDCNLEALKLYGFKDKQEYIDRFFELSPEYQPDGSLSMKKIREIHKIVLNREYMVFEWMHKKIDGELIPSKITAIRVELGDGSKGIAAYVRDLREEKAAEAKIKEAEKRAQIMLDATPLCTQLWDENQNVVDCNLEGIKLYGFQNKQEYIDNFFELSPEYQPDGSLSKEKAREQVKAALDKGRIVFEWTHRKLNGELIPAEITLVRVELANGHIGVAGYTRDLREAKAAEAKIKEGNERNKIMFDAMPLSCSLWDENMKGIDCNDEVLKLLGLSNKEEFLCYLFDFFPEYQPDGRQSKEKAFEMLKLTLSKGRAAFEWMYRTLNGDPVPCDTTLIRVRRNSKNIIAVYMRDLREVKEQSAKLDQVAKLAYSDPLTGAYNRRYFMQYANLHVQNDVLSSMGIIMLDLDHFKKVNDTYGHEAGDQALKLVSAATQSVLRESDLFARFGGEEFIVLAQNIDLDNLTKLAFRICREIENINFFYNETKIPITISAGVAMRGSREQSLNEVIGQADNALYQAKSNGRNRVEVYVNQANKNLRGAT